MIDRGRRRSRYGEARDLVLDTYASFSPRRRRRHPAVLRRALDRRADPPAQARRRVLRLHGAERPPVRDAQLHRPPPGRADDGARARPRPARRARPAPGRLSPVDAADARRDRVGVRGGARVRPACSTRPTDDRARLGLLAERIDGAIATVFRQMAMNRFEHLVHTRRRVRGRAVGRPHQRARGPRRQVELFGDSVEMHRRLPDVVVLRAALHQHARLRLRLRLRAAARAVGLPAATCEEGESFVPRYLELLAAGGSRSPEELGGDRRDRSRRSRVLGFRARARRGAAARRRGARAQRDS